MANIANIDCCRYWLNIYYILYTQFSHIYLSLPFPTRMYRRSKALRFILSFLSLTLAAKCNRRNNAAQRESCMQCQKQQRWLEYTTNGEVSGMWRQRDWPLSERLETLDWRWKRSNVDDEREVGSESERGSKNGQAGASHYETVTEGLLVGDRRIRIGQLLLISSPSIVCRSWNHTHARNACGTRTAIFRPTRGKPNQNTPRAALLIPIHLVKETILKRSTQREIDR